MNQSYLKTLLILLFFSYHAFSQKTAEDWIKSGNTNDSLKKYKEALTCFNTAFEMDPENVNVRYYRGYVKYELNDFKGALVDFDAVIKKIRMMQKHFLTALT